MHPEVANRARKVPRRKEYNSNSAWKGRKPGRVAEEGEARPGARKSMHGEGTVRIFLEQLDREKEQDPLTKALKAKVSLASFIPLGTLAGQRGSQE